MDTPYESQEPARSEVDRWPGPVLLEFGNAWCGHCRAAKPHVESALSEHPGVRHVRIADASGRRLGRSFRVKLWPTFVFLRDGAEVARLVRPGEVAPIRAALAQIDARA
jgi:thioredoxin 1